MVVKKTTKKNVKNSNSNKTKIVKNNNQKKEYRFNLWTLSIYVYWLLILLAIAGTFYILGRYRNVYKHVNNVEITEEKLITKQDYLKQGKDKIVSGDLESAIVDFTSALGTDESGIEAYILRGETYMQLAKYNNALEDFNSAIELDSLNAIAYYDRALLYIKLENYTAALKDINNSLSSYVTRKDVILKLRDIYAKRGQLNLWLKNYEGAVSDYTNSLARPDGIVSYNVYAERAEAYTALERYAEAIADYESAIRIISEQIQAVVGMKQKESLSRQSISYFEKSAALNLKLGNVDMAKSDLNSAYIIALSLNDAETTKRLLSFIKEL